MGIDLRIPVYEVVEDLVVESSLAGCACAAALAASGRGVMLAGSSLSPGREIAAGYRAWHPTAGGGSDTSAWNNVLRPSLRATDEPGISLIDLTDFTTRLEDRLLDEGVRLLYGQTAVGLVTDAQGRVKGALLGGKAGLLAILAERVIDASDAATLLRVAGCPSRQKGPLTLSWITYADGLPDSLPDCRLPDATELCRRGPWLQWTATLPVNVNDPQWTMTAANTMRHRLIAAINTLRKKHGCAKVTLVREAEAMFWRRDAETPVPDLPQGLYRPDGIAADIVRLENNGILAVLDGGAAAAAAMPPVSRGSAGQELRCITAPASGINCDSGLQWGCSDPRGGCERFGFVAWRGKVAAATSADILVAGGGTSGIPAAVAAAEGGCRTRLLEQFCSAGGTQTVGGVPKYWYGRETPFVKQHDSKLKRLRERYGLSLSLAKFALAARSGASMDMPSTAVAVAVDGRRFQGVLATGPHGLLLHRARNFIDATGDGDLAAWSGHDYTYGNGRDEATLWYSLAKYVAGHACASREYASVVDLRHPGDLTRAVIASRRRDGIYGRGDIPCPYCAPRESRHINGRASVDYEAILLGHRPPDTIVVCRSNFDIKGISQHETVLAGFVEPDFHRNYDCPLPWRALLPGDYDNLAVTGKAYSATTPAFALARMQRDLIAMGAATGIAGACAGGSDLAAVGIPALQKALYEAGILVEGDLEAVEQPKIQQLLHDLDAGTLDLTGQLHLLAAAVACAGELKRRVTGAATAPPARLMAARILWQSTGDRSAGVYMLRELERLTSSAELPDVAGGTKRHDAPDHGWAPVPCYLIHALSARPMRGLIPVLDRLAGLMPASLARADRHFHYVFAIARAAERFATQEPAPALRKLLALEWIQGKIVTASGDPRLTSDTTGERFAFLALCIARAAAACGMQEGFAMLREFRGDQRRWLALGAARALG